VILFTEWVGCKQKKDNVTFNNKVLMVLGDIIAMVTVQDYGCQDSHHVALLSMKLCGTLYRTACL
jgi:hypothetical protein